MPAKEHLITREIGIDAGHRVTYHGSKCRNIHGHRYTIQATCAGPLFDQGEQEGMVLDFGFLKEEMMDVIDGACDHGFIMWNKDPLLGTFLNMDPATLTHETEAHRITETAVGKMYVVPFVPTAENLARHWFDLLAKRVNERTDGQARMYQITVWETPNCSAQYPSVPT